MKVKIDNTYLKEGKVYAYWNEDIIIMHKLKIDGCPMGRGPNADKAIKDLVYRTNFESGTNFTVQECKVDKIID